MSLCLKHWPIQFAMSHCRGKMTMEEFRDILLQNKVEISRFGTGTKLSLGTREPRKTVLIARIKSRTLNNETCNNIEVFSLLIYLFFVLRTNEVASKHCSNFTKTWLLLKRVTWRWRAIPCGDLWNSCVSLCVFELLFPANKRSCVSNVWWIQMVLWEKETYH